MGFTVRDKGRSRQLGGQCRILGDGGSCVLDHRASAWRGSLDSVLTLSHLRFLLTIVREILNRQLDIRVCPRNLEVASRRKILFVKMIISEVSLLNTSENLKWKNQWQTHKKCFRMCSFLVVLPFEWPPVSEDAGDLGCALARCWLWPPCAPKRHVPESTAGYLPRPLLLKSLAAGQFGSILLKTHLLKHLSSCHAVSCDVRAS